MNINLSVIIAAGNDQDVIEGALKSVMWADEIIIVLSETSTDKTKDIALAYTPRLFITANHLGRQRKYGILKAEGKWILVLDTDERISIELKHEIKKLLITAKYDGFLIPYKNYFLNHPVKFGNQRYKKLRLFKKEKGEVEDLKTHPEIIVKGSIGETRGVIEHYSFRSISQVLKKFTYYAKEDLFFLRNSEQAGFKKLFIYPLHMFWSVFVEDEGWRDGIWGLGLALCFAYYEFMRYYYLLKAQLAERKPA